MTASVAGDVGVERIRAARDLIAPHVLRTPLLHSQPLSDRCGVPVLLKLECAQPTGSFKVRGAFNAILSLEKSARAAGIVTASAGNHGQAVALAAQQTGARATVFVPKDAPQRKRRRIAELGAVLRDDAADYDDAERLAQEYADVHGATFVHAFSDPDVVAGQGTVGLEILEDAPDTELVIVPVGGGGLAAGVGAVLRSMRPDADVVGVQSEETRAMHAAFAAGRVVPVPITPTLADGLAGCTDRAAYERLRPLLRDLRLVSEAAIADAIRELHREHGLVVEGSGAVGVAALLAGVIEPKGETVVIVSGGNIDDAKLREVLAC